MPVLLDKSDDERKTERKQHWKSSAAVSLLKKVLLRWNLTPMCPPSSLQPLQIACLNNKSSTLWSFCPPLTYYFAMHHVASRQFNCFFTLCKPFNFGSSWAQWPRWHHFPTRYSRDPYQWEDSDNRIYYLWRMAVKEMEEESDLSDYTCSG